MIVRGGIRVVAVVVVAATLVAAPAIGTGRVLAQAAGKAAKAKVVKVKKQAAQGTPTPREAAEAREILKALRDLAASVEREGKGSPKSTVAPPERPAKSITPPTLDAAGIDALIDKALAAAKVTPARIANDEEFVRRVCLDVAGRLPGPEQVASFCRSKEKDKRSRLIDYLLESPEFATNWARYWRDVIAYRATNENKGQVRFPELEAWLAEQFAKNRPWDEVATDLITATGRNDENGAAVFAVAHQGADLPLELAGEVSRIFLGVQIQCAQCHDHPTDPWKRRQFHEFAAFFNGVQVRPAERRMPGQGPPPMEVRSAPRAGKYAMPDLKDPQKKVPITPRFFLSESAEAVPDGLTTEQRRALAASYVVGQDNPWFAKAFVNRAWFALMGDGFFNPVDDMGPARTARDLEVLEAISSQWQRGGYDVRWLFRTILNTRAYQREFKATNTAAGRTLFAANNPGRLRADQLLDALAQAINVPTEGRFPKEEAGKGAAKKVGPQDYQRRFGPRIQFNNLFGVDPSTAPDDVLGTIPQALFLMNSPQVNRQIEARPGTVLGEIVAGHPDNHSALVALYLRVLARRPTTQEMDVCEKHLLAVGDRKAVFEDILWCLVNSTEFINRR
ncbi:MAG TPA: DUF1549 domain-containing protein [Isosphaeraceae bacterium]|jgi:hypothetical protein|nr:DUF1549 domain-containing protein [Isosphaeraceae bacterium]